ncbi:MAG: hypothetical protein JWQ90_273 [Hydrocarboniphaga sp.]|uniref:hypothetical protein n=1 Tax=Hydrocarboniphaga sp. TaxID=2033016 RepID=UPI00260AB693|nr:hypothetical protein [Hydrocarboniphaga sp.]MDB5967823.1 hypothetical protein [Hydrocarboniphaga sp.]
MANASRSSGKMGSSARIVAVLAAMSPVVAGIYQQSQQQRQHNEQRHTEQQTLQENKATRLKEASDRQHALDIQADKATAESLQAALVVAQPQETLSGRQLVTTEPEFCTRLFFAATQLGNQAIADRTRAILYAAMRLRRTSDEQLRVCQCSSQARIGSWLGELQQMIPPQGNPAGDRLSSAVRSAIDECTPATAVAAKPTQIELLQTQLKQVAAQRDVMLLQLGAASQMVGSGGPSSGSSESPQSASPAAPVATTASPPPPPAPCLVDSPADNTSRIRVFIQVPDSDAKTDAEILRTALNAQAPFKSPGIETVGPQRSPQQLEIRYTYPADQPAARILEQALDSKFCGGGGASAKLVYQPRFQGRADSGVLEVWWPKPAAGSPKK